jgi:dUTP pyrophosphatase
MEGIHLELPPGFLAVIAPRSGITMRGIEVKLGYVDSDFRGSIGIMTHNLNTEPVIIPKNTRLAQLILQQHFDILSMVCNSLGDLSETQRDQGGFGSTGGDAILPIKDMKSITDGKTL